VSEFISDIEQDLTGIQEMILSGGFISRTKQNVCRNTRNVSCVCQVVSLDFE
jgi:hypothetical protein